MREMRACEYTVGSVYVLYCGFCVRIVLWVLCTYCTVGSVYVLSGKNVLIVVGRFIKECTSQPKLGCSLLWHVCTQ